MLKVMQIIPDLPVAGAETMLEQLTYGLKDIGCEVSVVCLFDYQSKITQTLTKNNIPIIYLHKKIGIDISQILKLYKLFLKEKPDVIHTHRNASQYALPAAIMAKIPVKVHTIHNVAEKENIKFSRKINKLFFKSKKATAVSLTEQIRETVKQEYNIGNNETPVIYNGMPVNEYFPKKTYCFGDEIKIFHVGRFSAQKNHKRLIDAFEIVCKKYPESKLLLAGTGELMEDIKALVKEKGIEEKVEFLGLCTDIKKLMTEADIFCLPSDYEGMPMTLIEAMASAIPIVATNVGGVSDMIEEEIEGLLCSCDAKDVANSLIELIEDEHLREKLGQAALLKSKDFSTEKMAEQYYNLYNEKISEIRKA